MGSSGGTRVSAHSELSGLSANDHALYERVALKNAASGYAGLNASSQLTDALTLGGNRRVACCQWNLVNLLLSSAFFIADRAYQVKAVISRIDVAGTSLSAVTAAVRKVPSGTAIASGTLLHTGTVDVKGAANTNQVLTLSATESDLQLAAGDALAVELAGIPTTAVGAITVVLQPI